ncbi:MAG: isoprenylcysteine carboxylmethyltransferase family protein [Anaerolineales bacterium]|nr:isoprenylcysteine carboxylmethyltransferase family protein [Anaerolineales bacterium]
MLSETAQATVTFLTVVVFYAMDFALIRRYDKRRSASGSGRAWDFTFFIFLAMAVLVLQPVLLPGLSLRIFEPLGSFLQLCGVTLIAEALALHYWSRIHLGQYYAERVEIQPKHEAIKTGPYKHVRHPVITSFFGIAAGLFLINPALTTLAALAYAIWDFTRAAKQEEELLTKTLRDYAGYARQTPRYLPRLWRRK